MKAELREIEVVIGARIRRRRIGLDMTMLELGRHVGVSVQQIHKYETAQGSISASRAILIARALGISAEDLFPVEPPEPEAPRKPLL